MKINNVNRHKEQLHRMGNSNEMNFGWSTKIKTLTTETFTQIIDLAKTTIAFNLGLYSLGGHVFIHEYGHALAYRALGCQTTPVFKYPPLYFESFVQGCYRLSPFEDLFVSAAGPFSGILAVLGVQHFFKSEYTPIFLLPHFAILAFQAVTPLLINSTDDYNRILSAGGPLVYAASVAFAMTPIALAIYKSFSSKDSIEKSGKPEGEHQKIS